MDLISASASFSNCFMSTSLADQICFLLAISYRARVPPCRKTICWLSLPHKTDWPEYLRSPNFTENTECGMQPNQAYQNQTPRKAGTTAPRALETQTTLRHWRASTTDFCPS